MSEQAKNYKPGQSSAPKMAGGGLKKPTYTGGDRSRSSSAGTRSSQAAPFRQGTGGGGGGGGARAKSSPAIPGSGPMASGSAGGSDSYPTRNTGVRQSSGHKHTTTSSSMRGSRSGY